MHPYATMNYADSLGHWGRPLLVPGWNTPVIVRDIEPGFADAAGAYPFAALGGDLAAGLQFLRREGLISIVLVLDDFHRPQLEELQKHFTLLRPFKTHYIHRNDKEPVSYDSHHKRALKQALKHVRVNVIDLKQEWKSWAALYDHLIAHLNLSGLHAFPHAHHEALGKIEGITAIGAWIENELVSGHVWASDGDYVHSHLVASNDRGYDSRAGFAINDFSLRHFAKAKVINFGGGAGNNDDAADGLARFKRGFANDTAKSYICGAILNQERYDELVNARHFMETVSFFPAYRAPSQTA